MTFNDDEPIVGAPGVSGGKPSSSKFGIEGNMKLRIINKTEAPLQACNFKVLVEITGSAIFRARMGVDLVTVLDISGSMEGEKLDNLKRAMQFLIKKLNLIDRLSVVTYSSDSKRECKLRQITDGSQAEIGKLVNDLIANGNTNIGAGLETALQVLKDRKVSSGRVTAIMLMSDGQNNRGSDPSEIPTGNVPVYTFGFGEGQDPSVLKSIADNSDGGTFSDVHNLKNLSVAFSQCLAGLLTVAVQGLKLTVTPGESIKINEVMAGNYPKTRDDNAGEGSVTVSFGDLYDKEVRKVVVDLSLPAVTSRMTGVEALEVTYAYSADGVRLDGSPVFATITRSATKETEREEVVDELNRLKTAASMKEARVMADDKELDKARDKLTGAHKVLEDEKPNTLIEMLKLELQMLLSLMASQDIYDKQGRPFALSSETSHARQRFAARGAVELLRLFATPRMDNFLQQAVSFDKDPSKPVPNEAEDACKEINEYHHIRLPTFPIPLLPPEYHPIPLLPLPQQPTVEFPIQPLPQQPTVEVSEVLGQYIIKGIRFLDRIDKEYPIQPQPQQPTLEVSEVLSHYIKKGIQFLDRIDKELNKNK